MAWEMGSIDISVPSGLINAFTEESVEKKESYCDFPMDDIDIKHEPKYAEEILKNGDLASNASQAKSLVNPGIGKDNINCTDIKNEGENNGSNIKRLQNNATLSLTSSTSLDNKQVYESDITRTYVSDGENCAASLARHKKSHKKNRTLSKKRLSRTQKKKYRPFLKCSKCSYATSRPEGLEKHLNDHKRFQNLSCDGCDFKSTPKVLRNHQYQCKFYLSNNHSSQPQVSENFSCPKCSHVADTAAKLARHKASHKKFQNFSCGGCSFKSTPDTLRFHRYKCEAFNLSKNNLPQIHHSKFNCPECSYIACKQGGLTMHLKSHKKFENLSCDGCGFKSTSKALKWHQRKCRAYLLRHPNFENNHTPSKNPIYLLRKSFSCSECSYIATTAACLERHKETHKQILNLSCDDCGVKITSSDRTLKHHQFKCKVYLSKKGLSQSQDSGNRSKFSCPECSYVSTRVGNVLIHQETHKQFQNSPCDGCDFKSTPKSLMHHQYKCKAYLLKNKLPTKNLNCPKCSYIAVSARGLESHKKSHNSKSQNLFCVGCGFKSTPSALRYHQYECQAYLRKNPGQESESGLNVSCSKCSYVATSASKLRLHLKMRHKIFISFSCDGCGVKLSPQALMYHQYKCKSYLAKNHLSQTEKVVNKSSFSCHKCSHVTNSLPSLKIHTKGHAKLENMYCPANGCNFKSTPRALVHHQFKCEFNLSKKQSEKFKAV